MSTAWFPDAYSLEEDGLVLVIGAAGRDMVGRLQTDLQPGTSSPAQIRTSFGGTARNVAENLAHLGQPVALITAVGADRAGEQLLEHAQSAGIDISATLQTSEHPTGTYIAVIDARGTLLYALDDMRVVSALTPERLRAQEEMFHQAALLFVDANLPKATLRTAFSLARKAHLPVCADPTSIGLAHKLQPYLDRLVLVVPNLAEAALLCGVEASPSAPGQGLEVAKHLVRLGVGVAVVTLAEFGVCYATSDLSGHIPAIRTEIVDPTGVGDALTATMLFAMLNSIPVDEAVRLGVSAASLTLRHRGAVLPDLSLERLYDHLVI
jgi:pseudouridine kinase